MVTLYQRSDAWYLNFKINGRRYRISTNTSDKRLADIKRQELEVELFKGNNPYERKLKELKITISELFRSFLKQAEKSKAYTTWKTERTYLKIWQEFFARKRIKFSDQINHKLISDFQVETDITPRSFNNALTLLRTVMNQAIKWEMIDKNPTAGYKKVKVPKRLRYFTDEELEKLLSIANTRQKAIVALGAYAGLRNGEMINLQWRDIDFDKRTLTVRSDEEVTPKGKRPRSIHMHSRLIKALKKYKDRHANNYVFPRSDGRGPKSGRNGPSNEFRVLLRQTCIKGSHHVLRHTFGTRLVKSGIPLPVVQELMGHADIESTMIYVHLHPSQHIDAISKL